MIIVGMKRWVGKEEGEGEEEEEEGEEEEEEEVTCLREGK